MDIKSFTDIVTVPSSAYGTQHSCRVLYELCTVHSRVLAVVALAPRSSLCSFELTTAVRPDAEGRGAPGPRQVPVPVPVLVLICLISAGAGAGAGAGGWLFVLVRVQPCISLSLCHCHRITCIRVLNEGQLCY